MGDLLLYFAAVLAGFWAIAAVETASDLGGRRRDRTADPLLVREVLYR